MTQGAGAMRRHRVDRDEQIGRRYGGGELVERDLFRDRVDDAGVFGRRPPAGCAALQVDKVDPGCPQQRGKVADRQRPVGRRPTLRVGLKDDADFAQIRRGRQPRSAAAMPRCGAGRCRDRASPPARWRNNGAGSAAATQASNSARDRLICRAAGRRRRQHCRDAGDALEDRTQRRTARDGDPRSARGKQRQIAREHDAIAETLLGDHQNVPALDRVARLQPAVALGGCGSARLRGRSSPACRSAPPSAQSRPGSRPRATSTAPDCT